MIAELHGWFETHAAEFASPDTDLALTDGSACRDKRAAWLDVTCGKRVGRLIVWDTGEMSMQVFAPAGEYTQEGRVGDRQELDSRVAESIERVRMT